MGFSRQFYNSLFARDEYFRKVLDYNPIAFWHFGEASGNVAQDISGHGFDGVYTGVMLGQPGIGDGETSPLFDGVNDYVNVYSVGLAGAFNGAEGTLNAWFKVSGAGVWTDGALREIVNLQVDANNLVLLRKSSVNNRVDMYYIAGGTLESHTWPSISSTDWISLGITWSATAGAVNYYLGGAAGTAGYRPRNVGGQSPASASTVIGAGTTVPIAVTSGNIARVAVWDYALSAAAMDELAVA